MGFENDKLERKDYADILTQMIDKPEKYKRNSDSDSFTMAIDSGWGTGKTEFLKMWEEELKQQNKYIVIKYNSWENDFAEEPLQSIIYTILSDDIFDKQNDIANGKEALKGAFETVINLVEQSSIPGIKMLATGAKGMKKVTDTMFQETSMDDKIEEFRNYKNKIGTIKEKLENITKNKKIILLIDELDRCKPLFAIKLLEIIKHIFNVKNMSFVFALDMTQLSYSVEKVYGTKIDATGYICRFFDYITKMPMPDTRTYIAYLMEKKPLIRKEFNFSRKEDFYASTLSRNKVTFIDLLQECVDKYQLSLRDINTIYQNFTILEEQELKEVDSGRAYALYLFLLLIKYKNLELFNKIFITHNAYKNNETDLKKIEDSEYYSIEAITEIVQNEKIKNIAFSNRKGRAKIEHVDNIKKEFVYIYDGWNYIEKCRENIELSKVFFYSDLMCFNNIKEMRIGDYIHKKLELFNFEWEKKQNQQEE